MPNPCGPWKDSPESFSKTDRKSTRLNSSHANISYAVFCLKKKNYRSDHASAANSPGSNYRAAHYAVRSATATARHLGDPTHVSWLMTHMQAPHTDNVLQLI